MKMLLLPASLLLMICSNGLFAATIDLSGVIPGVSVDRPPEQIRFSIYATPEDDQPIASQVFWPDEWQADARDDGVAYQVQFLMPEAGAYDGMWFRATADGVGASELQQIRAVAPDMYVAGQIETGVGIRFPGGGLQTEPGITSELDPGLAPHASDASAHHSRYADNEAVTAVLAADGPGSGLNADLVDGQHASSFATSGHGHDADYVNVAGDTMTGDLRFQSAGVNRMIMDVSVSTINLRDSSNVRRVALVGGSGTGGQIYLYEDAGIQTLRMDGEDLTGASIVQLMDDGGMVTMELVAQENAGDGGEINLYNVDNLRTVQIDGDSGTKGGYLQMYDRFGNATITMDADYFGDGRITTQELSITGGSDLSEQFDIDDATLKIQPGMLVSIDPLNPGKLVPSREAYDRKVAGIVSGAGGVKPGMMMGQVGSIANGEYPVALTGRVYAMADAGNGAIQPGDLLTTSAEPGVAMKVRDHRRAAGAVIGKAMTPLQQGRGLVLVLVSLQ